jgi:hypothetical protein
MSSKNNKSKKKADQPVVAKDSESESDSSSTDEDDLNEQDAKSVYQLIGDLIAIMEQVNTIFSESSNFSGVSLGNPEQKSLKKYKKFYTRRQSGNLHAEDFRLLLNRFKHQFLKGDDQFIIDGAIMIRSQEEAPDSNPKVKIMLSSIYKRAVNISDTATKRKASGLASAIKDAADKIVLPEKMLQILYKIFIILDPESKSKYTKHIDKLTKHIEKNSPQDQKISSEAKSQNVADSKDQKSASFTSGAPATGGIASMINSLRPVLENSGMPIPPDSKMPSDQEINALFSGILQSDMLKNIIGSFGSVATSMQNGQSPIPDLSKMNGEEIKATLSNIAQPLINSAVTQMQTQPPSQNASSVPFSAPTPTPGVTGSSAPTVQQKQDS